MTSLTAVEYQTALRRVNISLPLSLVQELLDIIDQLKDAGKVRADDGQYSAFDFIGNVVEKGGSRKVWERLVDEHPEVVTFCHNFQFKGAGQRKTPVTNELGMLYIAFLLPGELGKRLRKASSDLISSTIAAYKDNLSKLFEQSAEPEVDQLRARILELEQQLQSATYPHSWSELHHRSGIVNKYQVRDAIKDYFAEGTDYVVEGKELMLSPSCFYILLVSFRSLKGTDIAGLPKIIAIETIRYFQYLEIKRKNTRCGSRKTQEVEGQQKLPIEE